MALREKLAQLGVFRVEGVESAEGLRDSQPAPRSAMREKFAGPPPM
jgi:hypothetical protein